jgi:uncharacterized membrane protein YbhN (UPF0104 family)
VGERIELFPAGERCVRAWSKRHQSKLVLLGKVVLLLLLTWGVWKTLASSWQELQNNPPTIHWGWIPVCGIIYLIGELGQTIFWHSVLRSTGQPVHLKETVFAFYASQIGKYAPGKALVLVIRAAILRREHLETTIIVATSFMEALLTMATGAAFAGVTIWLRARGEGSFSKTDELLLLTAAAIVLACGLPTIPWIWSRTLRLLGIGKLNPTAADKVARIPHRIMALGVLSVALGWIIQGLSLWAALRALGIEQNPLEHWAWHASVVALAVGAGFVSMIPGGFMGRELVHINMMKLLYPDAIATASALILRLVWLVAEALASSILYVWLKCRAKSRSPAAPVPVESR